MSVKIIGAYGEARWSRPPLRSGILLRPVLLFSERLSRLARRDARAPASREDERGAAEVLSIHLVVSRPIVVAERRVAAAVDDSPAAAIEVTMGPAGDWGLEDADKMREGRATKGVDSRSSYERGVDGAAVRGGRLPGLTKARMTARRAACSRECRSVSKSETDGCMVDAPTTLAPPWPQAIMRAGAAQQANATAGRVACGLGDGHGR